MNAQDYEQMNLADLVLLKRKKYGKMDIQSPVSEDERRLSEIIAKKFSEINQAILEKRKAAKWSTQN